VLTKVSEQLRAYSGSDTAWFAATAVLVLIAISYSLSWLLGSNCGGALFLPMPE
jgi:hypothetical protein